jgi:hypothetical protein
MSNDQKMKTVIAKRVTQKIAENQLFKIHTFCNDQNTNTVIDEFFL